MSFLTLGGIAIPTSLDGAQENAIERIGSDSRAYAGNLRSTVRDEKRSWTVKTRPLSSSEESNIRAVIADGAFVPMDGDYVNNTPITVSAAIAGVSAVKVTGGFRSALTLAIKET